MRKAVVSLLVVAVSIWCLSAFAQPADVGQVLAAGIKQVQDGDYDGAILTLDSVARRLAAEPSRARELSRAYLYLGIAYVGKGQEAAARARFREALGQDRDLSLPPEEFPPKVINVFEAAKEEATREAKPTDLGIEAAQQQLERAESTFGPESAEAGVAMGLLALKYLNHREFALAEPLLQRELAIEEKLFGSDSTHVADTLNTLALLHDEREDWAGAEAFYKHALAIREKRLGSEHLEVARTLQYLANTYYREGQYAVAEPLYRRALAILEKIQGPEGADLAVELCGLAYLLNAEGKPQAAEPLLKRALTIQEKAPGPFSDQVSYTLAVMAATARSLGRTKEAEQLEARVVAIAKTQMQKNASPPPK
jgi:tetratricopeptide (TPR) repeat protein